MKIVLFLSSAYLYITVRAEIVLNSFFFPIVWLLHKRKFNKKSNL